MHRSTTYALSALALIGPLLAAVSCGKSGVSPTLDAAPVESAASLPLQPKPTANTPVQETGLERIQEAPTLRAALELSKPLMSDPFNDTDDGTRLLLIWAARSMVWKDVGVTTDETSFGLVRKDVDEERGKRLCTSGVIVQITVERTDNGKLHRGLLLTDAENIVRFLAVGSSGDLVENNRARFCGVVTGLFDYPNSDSGTSHAIKVVGLFDLRANRALVGAADSADGSPPPSAKAPTQATPTTTVVAAPSSSPSSASSEPMSRRPVRPVPTVKRECDPPYTIDPTTGHRRYKTECN